MEYFFTAEKLSVGYSGKPVVTEIEVSIKKGQILTLIGPNGSGKSTILKSISGQLKPIAGLMTIGGDALKDISFRAMARRTAVVLTERPKPELMTCGDVVALGRYPYTGRLGLLSKDDHEKIETAMKRVNALELHDQSFDRISDGQLQRVMLARALCQEPEIIVLDEPTSFLDIRYAAEILDTLRTMADELGITVIMSLHELNYAKRVSDLVMCIKAGRVLYLDKPEAVFTQEIVCRLFDLSPTYYTQLFGEL